MKKKLLALMGLSAPAVMFAEGSAASMDTTAAANLVQSCTTGLVSLIETVTPYVTTLILAGLAIWAAIVLIKLVKRVFSRAG